MVWYDVNHSVQLLLHLLTNYWILHVNYVELQDTDGQGTFA